MNKKIARRVLDEANYMIENEETIREIAKNYGVSKSTVHKDLSTRLIEIDEDLYAKVSKILKFHIDIRHISGRESTRQKFQKTKQN